MNILSIDENTVIVEKRKTTIDILENTYGFQVIPIVFDAYMFGGGCSRAVDLYRDGTKIIFFLF